MAGLSKRQKAAYAKIDREAFYSVEDAVGTVKGNATAKFDETIEISMNLGIDPRHADQMVRGVVQLPNGTGKTVRVAVFARGAKADEALAAGADVVGADDLADKIQAGQIDFDRCIAAPDMMGLVGPLGKVLGPRGLMPSPRAGTVTADIKKTVGEYKAGKVEFRNDPTGIVHAVVGKASFDHAKLVDNIRAFLNHVLGMQPSSIRGQYLKSVSISGTMTPGVRVAG